jgi:5-methylcytosine-specific restriction endonuclease McrA
MSRIWTGGSTRRWRRIRAYVLDRDHHTCQAQVRGLCDLIATEAHHTLGRAITGDNPDYLIAACKPCNIHIGDPQTHPADCPLCTPIHTTRTDW